MTDHILDPHLGGPPDRAHAVGSRAELLAALEELLPEVRERASEGERERSLPADLAAKLEAAGLFRTMRVRELGGLELAPSDVVDVVERLAHADASTGWVALIGATASAFFGWLEPDAARTMLSGRPGGAASCVFAPTGSARPDGSGFRVSGHWRWNSGIRHAPWRQVSTVELGPDGEPVTDDDGAPRMRVAFVPADVGEVVDNWDTMGLRGTGSHDLALADAFVPESHTFVVGAGSNRHEGSYARLTIGDLVQIGVLAFPLGIARRALEEFTTLARGKSRGLGRQWSVAEDGEVQADVGRAEGELAAAHAFVDAAAAELWASAQGGGPERGAQLQAEMASAHALRAAQRVVDVLFGHAGAASMRLDQPLQRCFRDLHAVAGHVFYSAGADRAAGRRLLLPDAPEVRVAGP